MRTLPQCSAIVSLFFALANATPARAQTRLLWPDSSAHIERYSTVEQCLSATQRARDSLERHSVVWRDTLALSIDETLSSLSPVVPETARRCSVRFVAASTALTDFAPLLQLFLLADDDSSAIALARRRLASVPQSAKRERASLLDTLVKAYAGEPYAGASTLAAQPARLAIVEQYALELGELAAASQWATRMNAYSLLMEAAWKVGDTARVRRAAEAVLATGKTLTAADRRSAQFTAAEWSMYRALNRLNESALLDSLRHGTTGYVSLQRSSWSKASGERPEALKFPLGQPAPVLEGAFWFRRQNANASRPSKGKVSLVVFLSQDYCTDSHSECWIAYAALHRLAHHFPELEFTLVAETHGFLSRMKPAPPAEEADTLRKYWLERDQLPGALVVTATDFWRLEAPDRRRINRDVPNRVHYSFGRDWSVSQTPQAYLVDRDGIIVDVRDLSLRAEEARLTKILDVVFSRATASR